MLRSLRSSLARFAVRRAAACQRFAPRRADFWLALEERPDAAVAAGDLYRRAGLLQEAAARFARAYAAGGGAEALWLNAQTLFQAGDERAADEALHLWATQVPGGLDRLSDARAELRGGKREG